MSRLNSSTTVAEVARAVEKGLVVHCEAHPDFGGPVTAGPYRWADGRAGWAIVHVGSTADVSCEAFDGPLDLARSFVYQVGKQLAHHGATVALAKAGVGLDGLLLAQLAWVADRDADAIADSYAWPPRAPLTPAELEEVERLKGIANELFVKAEALGQSTGTDAVFGTGATFEDAFADYERGQKRDRMIHRCTRLYEAVKTAKQNFEMLDGVLPSSSGRDGFIQELSTLIDEIEGG